MTISIHALIDRLDNAQLDRLERHLKITKPRYVRITAGSRFDVAMQFIERLSASCPATRPMLRQWPDDGLWKITTVDKFYSDRIAPRKAWLSKFHVVWIPDNESLEADLRPYAAWMDSAIMRAHADGIELGVGTFSTGNPQALQLEMLDRMFQALEDFGGVYTPHEYFGRTPQASAGHLNRYTEAWAYCDRKGIQRPPTVIGEYGLCGVTDGHLDPYAGFRKLGILSADYARNFIITNYEAWYKTNGVTVCTFCAGDWDGHGFDVDEGYYQVIEAYAAKAQPPVVVIPPPPPPIVIPPPVFKPPMPEPTNKTGRHSYRAVYMRELLRGAGTGYDLVGRIQPGDELDIWDDPDRFDSDQGVNYRWAVVTSGDLEGKRGWVLAAGQWDTITRPEPPPVVVEIPVRYRMQVIKYEEVSLPPSIAKLLMDKGLVLEAIA